jgi:hypothetical protein
MHRSFSEMDNVSVAVPIECILNDIAARKHQRLAHLFKTTQLYPQQLNDFEKFVTKKWLVKKPIIFVGPNCLPTVEVDQLIEETTTTDQVRIEELANSVWKWFALLQKCPTAAEVNTPPTPWHSLLAHRVVAGKVAGIVDMTGNTMMKRALAGLPEGKMIGNWNEFKYDLQSNKPSGLDLFAALDPAKVLKEVFDHTSQGEHPVLFYGCNPDCSLIVETLSSAAQLFLNKLVWIDDLPKKSSSTQRLFEARTDIIRIVTQMDNTSYLP